MHVCVYVCIGARVSLTQAAARMALTSRGEQNRRPPETRSSRKWSLWKNPNPGYSNWKYEHNNPRMSSLLVHTVVHFDGRARAIRGSTKVAMWYGTLYLL